MFKEIYTWNKKHLPGYYEIFLDIPINELKKRDPKGIYRKFSLGKLTNVAGLDLKIQKPTSSDLQITDCRAINTETIISYVISRFSNSL
jgi:adenylylsulfate kinase